MSMPDYVPSAPLPPDGPLTLSSGRVVHRERVEQGGDRSYDSTKQEPWSWRIVGESMEIRSDGGGGTTYARDDLHIAIGYPATSQHMPPSLQPRLRVPDREYDSWEEVEQAAEWVTAAQLIAEEDAVLWSKMYPWGHARWGMPTDGALEESKRLREVFGVGNLIDRGWDWKARNTQTELRRWCESRGIEMWDATNSDSMREYNTTLFTVREQDEPVRHRALLRINNDLLDPDDVMRRLSGMVPVTANNEPIGYVESINADGTADFVITDSDYRDTIVNGQQWPYRSIEIDTDTDRPPLIPFNRPATTAEVAASIAEQARNRKD